MSPLEITNIVLSILSFILALISIISVIVAIKQNNTIIKHNTRPYVVVYGKRANYSDEMFYLIIKNFGKSGALIKSISFDVDLQKFSYIDGRVPFANIENTCLVPNQLLFVNLDMEKIRLWKCETFKATVKYDDLSGNEYEEEYNINYQSLTYDLHEKAHVEDKNLRVIARILQEMVEKDM